MAVPSHSGSASASTDYTVVARRYRPQQLSDLIGQEHVAGALANALNSGRIAHAYLFTGARGVGKTSTARILAKALNCEQGPTATPCDRCPSCLAIAAGEDIDVLEIDAASNTGVENIRELRQNVGFRPQRSRFKVYIIDEVHMLSTSAFNALLKTLEEPPSHVKFIFATTEIQKIPVTILSRCQRFDFASIGPAKVFETLQHIVRKEGLEAEDEALRLISRRAGGSMRDAQTLLDQLLGSSTSRLTADAVHRLLGTADDEQLVSLATSILQRDSLAALAQIGAAVERGQSPGELIDQLIEYWRGLMLTNVAGDVPVELAVSPTLQESIRQQARNLGLETILSGIDLLSTAKARMRGNAPAQVLIEAAAVRLSRLEDYLSVTELWETVRNAGTTPSRNAEKLGINPELTEQTRALSPQAALKKNSLSNGAVDTTRGLEPSPLTPSSPNSPIHQDLTPENLAAAWEELLRHLGGLREEQLRKAGLPAITGPKSLVIQFPDCYTAAYDACVAESSLEQIRAALKRQTGADWQIVVELLPGAQQSPTRTPVMRVQELQELPLFRKAAETLGAELVQVDQGFHPGSGLVGLTPASADSSNDIEEI